MISETTLIKMFMFWKTVSERVYFLLLGLLVFARQDFSFLQGLDMVISNAIQLIFIPNLVGYIYRDKLKEPDEDHNR